MKISMTDPSARYYVSHVRCDEGRMIFDLATPKGIFEGLSIPALGEHMVWAAAFAAAVGFLRGMPPVAIQRGLDSYRAVHMRQNIERAKGI